MSRFPIATRTFGFPLICLAALAAAQEPGTIATGNVLFIDVYRHPEYSTTTQVAPSGNVTVPQVGNINVLGLTENEATARVRERLIVYGFKNPLVTVSRNAVEPGRPTRTAQMRTTTVTLDNSGAESISDTLQGMSSEGGSISFHKETNTIIITDTPSTIENMMAVIATLDDEPGQRTQVLIQAKIAEVQVGAMKELGIRWWTQGKEGLGGYYPMPTKDPVLNALRGESSGLRNESVGGRSGAYGGGSGRRFVNEAGFDRRLNVPVHIPATGQFFLGLLNEHFDIGVLLDALMADNKAEMLAEPFTLTVNHQKAEIRSVEEFPYTEFGTEITGRTTFGTKFLELGIKLIVTPHVCRDEKGPYIKLDLEPEVSYAVGSINGVPIRNVRSSKSPALVRNGQTLVIGGIYSRDYRNISQRVPVVGKLPLIGALFRRKEKVQTRTELMVFVTPTIYKSPEDITWDKMIDLAEIGADMPAATSAEPEPTTRRE